MNYERLNHDPYSNPFAIWNANPSFDNEPKGKGCEPNGTNALSGLQIATGLTIVGLDQMAWAWIIRFDLAQLLCNLTWNIHSHLGFTDQYVLDLDLNDYSCWILI